MYHRVIMVVCVCVCGGGGGGGGHFCRHFCVYAPIVLFIKPIIDPSLSFVLNISHCHQQRISAIFVSMANTPQVPVGHELVY